MNDVSNFGQRLSIDAEMSFGDFRDRYEPAVPSLDVDRFTSLISRQESWESVVAATARNTPRGFIRYWSSDVGSLMSLAGDVGSCASYLMGNHTIAQRMYTHDPAVML
jgi:hypothetical protein